METMWAEIIMANALLIASDAKFTTNRRINFALSNYDATCNLYAVESIAFALLYYMKSDTLMTFRIYSYKRLQMTHDDLHFQKKKKTKNGS